MTCDMCRLCRETSVADVLNQHTVSPTKVKHAGQRVFLPRGSRLRVMVKITIAHLFCTPPHQPKASPRAAIASAGKLRCDMSVDVAVIATEEWPHSSEITLRWVPLAIATAAPVCRRVCRPMSPRPARSAAILRARRAFRGSHGSPTPIERATSVSLNATAVDIVINPLNLDVIEAGKVLGCGRSTVYELIASGALTSIKLGRRRLVTYASCVDLVDRLAHSAA